MFYILIKTQQLKLSNFTKFKLNLNISPKALINETLRRNIEQIM